MEILFESPDLLVLNKPPGVVVFPTSHHPSLEDSLAGFVRNYLGEKVADVGRPGRFGFVHRLDRETSGVILAAKNRATWDFLTGQFRKHEVRKEYSALVWGEVKEMTNDKSQMTNFDGWREISAPIERHPANTERFTVVVEGEPAITRFKIEKILQFRTSNFELRASSFQAFIGQKFSLLRVQPVTGRTHQIRVHLKALGHPIVGDWLYSGRKRARWVKPFLARQFLHAQKLGFVLPNGGTYREFEASLPDDLKRFLAQLQPH